MDNEIQILACGNSSVGGVKWFFVGIDKKEMAIVTSEQCYSDDDPKAWKVLSYSPGIDQNKLDRIEGEQASMIITVCRTQQCEKQIDWGNKKAIRDLYWKYKE
ncbi:MAG TPA: hypothetical protein DCZ94_10260 [Lentisphaeria bacterium]|nr:MAG: hypothetical protein A2X48_11135 [Lentisphaerae bacterium GWF2_49_21]HBC87327.1 hypothetical protein [Lentisphaeria bacterium]